MCPECAVSSKAAFTLSDKNLEIFKTLKGIAYYLYAQYSDNQCNTGKRKSTPKITALGIWREKWQGPTAKTQALCMGGKEPPCQAMTSVQ